MEYYEEIIDKLDPMEEMEILLENDEISAEEEGFMMGWKQAQDDDTAEMQ